LVDFAPGADISVLGYDAGGNPSPIPYDLGRLVAAVESWKATGQVSGLYWSDYFWLDVLGGEVVAVQAQYLP
jgi:hypothetical protein